jgi:hypothetical protein
MSKPLLSWAVLLFCKFVNHGYRYLDLAYMPGDVKGAIEIQLRISRQRS